MSERSVKLFNFLQKYYRTVGIHSPQSNQIRCPFNWKNVFFVICLVKSISTTTAYLLFQAETIIDIGISIFFLACLILGLTLYLIPIWQMGNITEFIESCETFIATSKCALCIKHIKSLNRTNIFDLLYCYYAHRITCRDCVSGIQREN